MRQTKWGSFVEVCINIFIGYWINFVANLVILPMFGFHITLSENLLMGVFYTFISVARGYIIRRWFEKQIHKAAMKLAQEE